MKFIIISDYSKINGGGAKVAIQTAVGLSNQGHKVIFFAGDSNPDKSLDKSNITTINMNEPDLLSGNKLKMIFNGIYNRKVCNKLQNVLSENDAIVLVHSWMKVLSPSIFKALSKQKKCFYITTHDYFLTCPNGGYFNYRTQEICKSNNRKSLRCLFCNCDSRGYLFKVWRYIRHIIQKKYLSKCNFKMFILSNLMNENINFNNNEKKLLRNPIDLYEGEKILDGSKDCFAYIGRISKEKGVKYFCEALKETGFRGIIIGSGDQLENLKTEYSKFKNIEFLGWKNMSEIEEILPRIKSLVFPSIWYEGAPLIIPEMQSRGIPAIVSNACSGIDYIKNDVNGWIFNSKDVNDLTNVLRKVNSIPDDLYTYLSKRTREIALTENNNLSKYTVELLKKLNI